MAARTEGTSARCRRQMRQSKCLWSAYPHFLLDLHIETATYDELHEARCRQVGGQATDLPAPCFVQLVIGGGFDVQVEQEVRVRGPKAFRLPHLSATTCGRSLRSGRHGLRVQGRAVG